MASLQNRQFQWKTAPSFKFQVSSFSRLFHEIFHDGTTSYAQHYELNRSRPVFNISRYFVTLNMMGANSATLHKWEYIVIKIENWQIVLLEKGLSRVAVRGIDHQQLLTEVVISKPHSSWKLHFSLDFIPFLKENFHIVVREWFVVHHMNEA